MLVIRCMRRSPTTSVVVSGGTVFFFASIAFSSFSRVASKWMFAASGERAGQSADDVAHLIGASEAVEQQHLLPDASAVGGDGQDLLDRLGKREPGLGREAAFPFFLLLGREVVDGEKPLFQPLDLGQSLPSSPLHRPR